MQTYRNISLAQINVEAGQSEYYFPKNTNWNGAQIERIAIVTPGTSTMVSPIDGQSLLADSAMQDLYFDLYAESNEEIAHSLHHSVLSYQNNHPLEIGRPISLSLSRFFFTTTPTTSGAVLMYVFYNGHSIQDVDSSENVTIRFSLDAGERLNFRDMINKYMHANDKNVKRMICWSTSSPAFLTLRDTTGKLAFTELSTLLFRQPIFGGTATGTQISTLPLDDVDLDFDNCWIHNTTSASQDHVITFEY